MSRTPSSIVVDPAAAPPRGRASGPTHGIAADSAGEGTQPGDRLIVGVWIAMGLVVARALLQAAVDASADGETGATLAQHFLEHVVDATSRAWLIVPPLAVMSRGRSWITIALRAAVAFAVSVALLSGWPDGELRYRPGFDSTRGFQGWALIAAVALGFVVIDRFATSPRRGIFSWSPATRFVVTAGVLLLVGGALATAANLLDQRRSSMEVKAIVLDLIDELPRARTAPLPDGRRVEVASLLADKGDSAAGGNKPALVVPVGGSVEFDADLPRYTSLSFSFAIDRGSVRMKGAPQQITYSVAVDGADVLKETLQPRDRADHRCWVEHSVLLTTREERRATIALRVEGSGDGLAKVRAGFGRPLLVRREWRPRVASDPERMNVVLVVVDSLRPDHLGCYGYARQPPTSSHLDKLAADSIVYERAFTPSSWTWPSIASLFTGLPPPSHGVENVDRCFLPDSLETFAERLAQRGCTTLGVTANPLVVHAKNFHQGFEEWLERPLKPAAVVDELFRDWARRYAGYHFFAYVHFADPHRPYNPPQQYAERYVSNEDAAAMRHAVFELRAAGSASQDPARAKGAVVEEEGVLPKLSEEAIVGLYDGEIASVDASIGRMLRVLEDERLLDRTIFVVTSLHGEVLTAGRAAPAGSSLAPDLLHVPLLIHDPRRPARREPAVVDLTRLAPTLLAAAWSTSDAEAADPEGGAPPAPGVPRGMSPIAESELLPPWGAPSPRTAYSHTARGILPGRERACELIGLVNDSWRLTMEPGGEIVDFADLRDAAARVGDPVAQRTARIAELLEWLAQARRDAVALPPFDRMDSQTESMLRQFGDRQR